MLFAEEVMKSEAHCLPIGCRRKLRQTFQSCFGNKGPSRNQVCDADYAIINGLPQPLHLKRCENDRRNNLMALRSIFIPRFI